MIVWSCPIVIVQSELKEPIFGGRDDGLASSASRWARLLEYCIDLLLHYYTTTPLIET